MKAASFFIGGKQYHAQEKDTSDGASMDANDEDEGLNSESDSVPKPEGGTFKDMNDDLPDEARSLLIANIAVNSSAFEDEGEGGNTDFVGSSTETALLRFLKESDWADYSEERDKAETGQTFPFSSDRKAMATVIKLNDKWIFLVKGAAEMLLNQCKSYATFVDDKLSTSDLDEKKHKEVDEALASYAERSLRNLALCYKEISDPPKDDSQQAYEDLANGLDSASSCWHPRSPSRWRCPLCRSMSSSWTYVACSRLA